MLDCTIEAVPRPVTDAEANFYRENGWVKLDRFISAELAADLLRVAQKLMGKNGEAHAHRKGIDIDLPWWPDYNEVGREGHEPFASLIFSPEMGRAAQRLNGRPHVGVCLFRELIACRLPLGRCKTDIMGTPPHQDFPSSHFDRMGYVDFWIALHEIRPEQGAMRFRSRSHLEGPLGWHEGGPGEHYRNVMETHPGLAERCPLSPALHFQPGDATAHSMFTIHEAPQNTTDQSRWALIVNYISADTRFIGSHPIGLEIGELFGPPRYPLITGPEI